MPKKAKTVALANKKAIKTISGPMNATSMIEMRDIKLTKFDKNRKISEQTALIFDNACKYGVCSFGRRFPYQNWNGYQIQYRRNGVAIPCQCESLGN